MLDKTNYTTRTDLTPEEISALVIVREKFVSSQVHGFNMQSCSSCIGHFVGMEMGLSPVAATNWTHQFAHRGTFQQLFFPDYGKAYKDITPSDAAIAITNFLNGDTHPHGKKKK